MKPRFELLHLGDLGFTVPAAAAIAAALAASGDGRAALRWCLLFGCAMLAVGLNKIAFMAWGGGIEALAFKAASGHAAGAGAVLPVLVYLATLFALAPRRAAITAGAALPGRAIRYSSLAAGSSLAAAVAVQLVLRCEHSAAEALAGSAIGAVAGWAAIGAGEPPRLRARPAALWFAAAWIAAAWLMQSLHAGYWMARAARLLASGQPLHSLALD